MFWSIWTKLQDKELYGTVVGVVENRTNANCISTTVTADYDLGDRLMKRVTLNIRSVASAPLPTTGIVTDLETTFAATGGIAAIVPTLTMTDTAEPPPAPDLATAELDPLHPMPPPNNEEAPTVSCHGTDWYDDDERTMGDINGTVPLRMWAARNVIGEDVSLMSDTQRRLSRLDYFLLMFPPQQLVLMHRLMNVKR